MAWCRMLRGMSGLDLASLGIPGDTEYLSEYCSNTNIGGGISLQKMSKKTQSYYLTKLKKIVEKL